MHKEPPLAAAIEPEPPVEPHVLDERSGRYIPVRVAEARADRTRARNRLNQARLRAEKKAWQKAREADEYAEIVELLKDIPAPPRPRLSAQAVRDDQIALREWLALDLPRQRQLRKNEDRIMACRMALLRERLRREELWIDPTPADLAPVMGRILKRDVDRREARKTLDQVLDLEKPGGPWWSDVVTDPAPPSV